MWNNIFASYAFTDGQTEIMKFFHIKYERNDAQNDFSAARKQAGQGRTNPLYMSNHEMDEIEMEGYIFDRETTAADKENELITTG